MSRTIEVLWREGRFHGARVITIESVRLGASVVARAEVLRQRVLRGDLRAPE